ncbi:MAG: family 20 glycosylhydrolase [Telluria sp.]
MPTIDPGMDVARAPLAIEWECLTNFAGDGSFAARLRLRNVSGGTIAAGWAVYFNTCRKIEPDSSGPGFIIEHQNGDLFRLSRTEPAAWQADEVLELPYRAQHWAISQTDAPLGFYLVPGDGGAAVDLGDPAITPFVRNEQLYRQPDDSVAPADAALRFSQNAAMALLPLARVGRITPKPLSARFAAGACRLGAGSLIVHDRALGVEAALLREMLASLPGQEGAAVVLEIGPVAVDSSGAPAEAYMIEILSERIRVRGASAHGVFNGVQTLGQLLAPATGAVPVGRVLDAPRFAYRGLMLDVARHFASVATVLRLLDCMALYKLNRFHFHLTDDEGWRLAIDGLPELTDIGSRRGVPEDGRAALQPSFGSGADVALSAGTGHYSADDFIVILRHAHARHIEVIPEFNMPGHARAAVLAMRARHDRLLAAGDVAGAGEYLLSDPGDASAYESVQLWRDNVVCIALPSVDRFIDKVVSHVSALYRMAGVPLRVIHTGGDEVPAGAWLGSPHCRELMAARGWTDVAELREDFVERCRGILARHGIDYAGWDETALMRGQPNMRFARTDFHVYVWNNGWGSGQEDCAWRLADAGFDVILSNPANLYFDQACAKDPEEPGYYWAGFVGVRQAFAFCPVDRTVGAPLDAMGRLVATRATPGQLRLDSHAKGRLAGLQGQLWGENARSRERLEYFAAPRVVALAERAWAADPGWRLVADVRERAAAMDRDWNEFANRLGQRELPRLDRAPLAYGYRLPPPGAVMRDGALHANVALPGLALRYTLDASEPHAGSALYRGPVAAAPGTHAFKIATFDTRGRKSRTVTIAID